MTWVDGVLFVLVAASLGLGGWNLGLLHQRRDSSLWLPPHVHCPDCGADMLDTHELESHAHYAHGHPWKDPAK
jgi:hypothetical protein